MNTKQTGLTQNPNPDRQMHIGFAFVHLLPRMLLSSRQPKVTRNTSAKQMKMQVEFSGEESVYLQFDRTNVTLLQQGWVQLNFGSRFTCELEAELQECPGFGPSVLGMYFADTIYGPLKYHLLQVGDETVKLMEILGMDAPVMQIAKLICYEISMTDNVDLYPLLKPAIEGLRQRYRDNGP